MFGQKLVGRLASGRAWALAVAFAFLAAAGCGELAQGGVAADEIGSYGAPLKKGKKKEIQLDSAVVIIELTDHDIELQAFADGHWTRMRLEDPSGKTLFSARSRTKLKKQAGVSEMFWASVPTHFLASEPTFDGTIEEFLKRFPEGEYEFEGVNADGTEIEGEAQLSHVLPALPTIVSPVSTGDDPPIVNRYNLVIDWAPVTTRFIGAGPVNIVEYQLILDPDQQRTKPWVDGLTRRALINLPGTVTKLTVPPEYLQPNSEYDFEVLAIEANGNTSISTGSFITGN